MPFWLKSVVAFVLLAALFVFAWGVNAQTAVSWLFVLVAALPYIIQQTPALYFRWTRLRYQVSNVTTTWNLGVRLTGDFSAPMVESFARGLAGDPALHTRILESTSERVLIHYNRLFTIELLLSPPEPFSGAKDVEFETLTVTVLDQQVPYRRSTVMMEESLIPFIERLQSAFTASTVLYSLRVRFDETNPFFGLYVQQLRKELITDFRFEFHLPSASPREYVRVGKDQLTIVSASLDRFRRAVNAGLTFTVVTA